MLAIHVLPMEASHNKPDITNYFLAGGLVLNFAEIFYLLYFVQTLFKKFKLWMELRHLFTFEGSIESLIFSCMSRHPQKTLPYNSLRRLRHYGLGV
jgi:hypothetical protein